VIGLTSAANAGFVEKLGCYDQIVTYDRVTSLPAGHAVALVDMAGNSDLRERLQPAFRRRDEIFRTHRAYPSQFHRTRSRNCRAKPSWFFAPDQIRKRAKEWGPGGIDARFSAAWSGFAPHLDHWLTVIEGRGPAAVKQVMSRRWRAAFRRSRATCCRWLSNRLSVRSRTV